MATTRAGSRYGFPWHLGGGFAVSPPIHQPLASGATNYSGRALGIINTKADAVVIAEIKFRDIAMRIMLCAMLIDALHSALEYGIEAFRRVELGFAAPIFARAVTHKVMCREMLAQA